MIADEQFQRLWKTTTPFKIPSVQSAFLGLGNEIANSAFMTTDLARSGLSSLHVNGYVHPFLKLKDGAQAGYVIPYYGLDGQPLMDKGGNLVMYRTRLKHQEFSKAPRYDQPTNESLEKYGLPGSVPYIHPLTLQLPGEVMICAEGEKKAVSILKYIGLPTFGIGGCQMWRSPDGSGSVHPWILRLLEQRGIRKVLIVPDGDVFKYDICRAYGTFAYALSQAGYGVEVLNPPDKIDDLIVQWGTNTTDRFEALPRIDPTDLVQSPAVLARRYNLAFRTSDKGAVTVHQTTANVMKLMEDHPGFPRFWRNLDTNRVYAGEEQAVPDLTEMEIANYFQHNLGFEKITSRMIFACIQALSKKNQRSPFLDWIRRQKWDGKPRLATWMQRLWGVEDTEFTREVATKWLVGACARMDKPGVKIDWMLITIGGQGVGKTSMPNIMFRGNSLTMYGEQNDKDLHMKLHSALVVGFDELDSFGKKETSFLKAMISTSEDHFRPPYGASVEVFQRRCTLYGCGNRFEFLPSDPSGYRRYPVVVVNEVLKFKELEAEVPQLWAEAWHLYTSGGIDYWEVKGVNEQVMQHIVANPYEEKVAMWLEAQMTHKVAERVKDGMLQFTMAELIDGAQLGISTMGGGAAREVAAYLRSIGATQKLVRNGTIVRRVYVLPVQK